jgi:hypothetical protein
MYRFIYIFVNVLVNDTGNVAGFHAAVKNGDLKPGSKR